MWNGRKGDACVAPTTRRVAPFLFLRYPMFTMKRLTVVAFALVATLGQGCTPAPAPTPEPQVRQAPPAPPPNIPPPTPVQPKAY